MTSVENSIILAEYIWIDGSKPTAQLRSKAKTIRTTSSNITLEDLDEWSFDGSSTQQATGDHSDCILKPVYLCADPIRGGNNVLVLCEVFNADGTPHESNTRVNLRRVLEQGASKEAPWIGFEQEYTLFQKRNPLGWPEEGFPAPQGPYYCGVGSLVVNGRDLVERHAKACLDAGLTYYGLNAEVMPGQWEFQIGYRGFDNEDGDVLRISDETWVGRWLLHRLSEEYGWHVSFDNKPIQGDWNGAGMHTNFSTASTRDKKSGRSAINQAVESLAQSHHEHVVNYGYDLDKRLTGLHETCDIDTFKHGISDRGCSIRIPLGVEQKGYGYFEDRRPGANADPYTVAALLCKSVCKVDGFNLEGIYVQKVRKVAKHAA